MRLDGDPALTFEVHGIQDLGFHFTIGEAATHLDETIGQGGLAMVDVGDDGEIADMTQVTHRTTLEKVAGDSPPKIAVKCTRLAPQPSRPGANRQI
ncbi:hypothetical protein D3C84_275920 [compost metagenome]